MNDRINLDQTRALAALVRTLRPEWDVPGIAKAIHDARDKGTTQEVIFAAIRLAGIAAVRSPAALASDGPQWRATADESRELGHRFARCPEPGHQSYPAWACGACRAEQIGTDEPRPVESPADPEAYHRGAELVRAAIPHPDPARLRAGDDTDTEETNR